MWKTLLTAGLLVGLSSPVLATPQSMNNMTQVVFDFSTSDTNYFYCSVSSPTVTDVRLENHSVLISGFDADGILEFANPSQLNQVYFTAVPDPNRMHVGPNVVVWFDGDNQKNVQCFSGKGGRTVPFGFGR